MYEIQHQLIRSWQQQPCRQFLTQIFFTLQLKSSLLLLFFFSFFLQPSRLIFSIFLSLGWHCIPSQVSKQIIIFKFVNKSNIILQIYRINIPELRMYIEPAQYLDLTERINILTNRYENCLTQKTKISEKGQAMEEKIRFLQARVQQLLKEQEREKHGIKQHVSDKAQLILGHINDKKQEQKKFIEQQINKVRNWSAINTLKKMQDKIMQNKSTSAQKQFYEKVKTLYVIEKRKTNCNQTQLFDWVTQLVKLKKSMDSDSLGNMSDISKIIQETQQNKKSLKKSQKPGSKNMRKSKQNQSQTKLPMIPQNEGMNNCENQENKKQREREKGPKIL